MQEGSGLVINLVFIFSITLAVTGLSVFILFLAFYKKLKRQRIQIINTVFMGQDNERGRIAMDLHDSMGAALFDIIQTIDEIELNDELKAMETKEDVKLKLTNAMETMRQIAHNLMPKTIKEHGLIYTVKKLFSNSPEGFIINFFDDIYSTRFNQNIEIHLFHIILELYNNTLKHSGANEINLDIIFEQSKNELSLTYFDNGKGFELHKKTQGIGLKNIRTRAELINGKVIMDTQNGFTITITIKL
jgi:signal transduction histidine kinase